MSNIKETVNEKVADHHRKIQAVATVVAVLAATYYLGKSRGKVNLILCQDPDNALRAEFQK